MAWSGDGSLFGAMGVLDFAGGTVVHIDSGVAALVIGRRKGYPNSPIPPHSLTLTVVGASMLWVGWSGFNTGSALAGLVAITPASGSVGPVGSIVIGVTAGVICYYAVTAIKPRLGYNDALDVFGVHAVG